jgi:hypothetical protein
VFEGNQSYPGSECSLDSIEVPPSKLPWVTNTALSVN